MTTAAAAVASVPEVLATVADLMDAAEARRIAACGRPLGTPLSALDYMVSEVVYGPDFRPEWYRIRRTDGLDAARAWMAAREELRREVCRLVYPNGLHSPLLSSVDVRALAEALTVPAAAA